jgi:hypothetical protein
MNSKHFYTVRGVSDRDIRHIHSYRLQEPTAAVRTQVPEGFALPVSRRGVRTLLAS